MSLKSNEVAPSAVTPAKVTAVLLTLTNATPEKTRLNPAQFSVKFERETTALDSGRKARVPI
jgi:hypothetical protein